MSNEGMSKEGRDESLVDAGQRLAALSAIKGDPEAAKAAEKLETELKNMLSRFPNAQG